jgi:hypothetical protein
MNTFHNPKVSGSSPLGATNSIGLSQRVRMFEGDSQEVAFFGLGRAERWQDKETER